MTTDFQREAADRIASEYDEQVRITPGVGRDHARMAVACPDGRYVLIDQLGRVVVDSRDLRKATLAVVDLPARALPALAEQDASGVVYTASGGSPPVRGYDPSTDVLLVETCDEEWTIQPPWRCAISVKDHLPPLARDAVLDRVYQWHVNVISPDTPLVVWEIRAGETEIRRVGG